MILSEKTWKHTWWCFSYTLVFTECCAGFNLLHSEKNTEENEQVIDLNHNNVAWYSLFCSRMPKTWNPICTHQWKVFFAQTYVALFAFCCCIWKKLFLISAHLGVLLNVANLQLNCLPPLCTSFGSSAVLILALLCEITFLHKMGTAGHLVGNAGFSVLLFFIFAFPGWVKCAFSKCFPCMMIFWAGYIHKKKMFALQCVNRKASHQDALQMLFPVSGGSRFSWAGTKTTKILDMLIMLTHVCKKIKIVVFILPEKPLQSKTTHKANWTSKSGWESYVQLKIVRSRDTNGVMSVIYFPIQGFSIVDPFACLLFFCVFIALVYWAK